MADFPRNIRVHMSSIQTTLDEFLASRSRAGRIRGRRLYPAGVKAYQVELVGLTNAERDSVENFLALNRKSAFNFYWPYGPTLAQVIWTDSKIDWRDEGGKLSSTSLGFAVVT